MGTLFVRGSVRWRKNKRPSVMAGENETTQKKQKKTKKNPETKQNAMAPTAGQRLFSFNSRDMPSGEKKTTTTATTNKPNNKKDENRNKH